MTAIFLPLSLSSGLGDPRPRRYDLSWAALSPGLRHSFADVLLFHRSFTDRSGLLEYYTAFEKALEKASEKPCIYLCILSSLSISDYRKGLNYRHHRYLRASSDRVSVLKLRRA